MYDNFHIPFIMPIIRLGGVYPIHMANSQTINKVVFLSYACFNSCQYLLQTYKARKETIGKSENDSNMHYSPLCPFLCFINKQFAQKLKMLATQSHILSLL